MERARDDGSESAATAPGPAAAPAPMKRLRMPKAIPAHLQQHHHQQQQQQLLLQQQQQMQMQQMQMQMQHQQLEAQFKNDAASDAMMMATDAAGDGQQWRRDEHSRFMQALETYGREQSGDEWSKITAFVQTRSVDEVRQHGRQYLQQLVQELSDTGRAMQSIGSLGFSLTPMATASASHDSQNDPNGQNHQTAAAVFPLPTGATGKPLKQPRSRAKSGGSKVSSQSSKGAQQQAQAAPASHNPLPRKNSRKPKVWTFEEDKIFENALANWGSDKPYSWPKIATALPGKTAKDARSRYEKLVGDIAMIETTEELDAPQSYHHQQQQSQQQSQQQPTQFATAPRSRGLSSRISPPPPIEVPPSVAKGDESSGIALDSPGMFLTRSMRGGRSSRDRGGAASSSSGGSMLSPTFLDFLTSEEKQPASAAALVPQDLSLDESMFDAGMADDDDEEEEG